MSASDHDKGLYDKFTVFRNDGQSAVGCKHHRCDYFVLDLTHDPYAADALLAYASACKGSHPMLSLDLVAKVVEITERFREEGQ